MQSLPATYCVNSTRQALLPIIRGETCKLSSTSSHTNLCRKVCLVWNLAFSKILHCTVGKSSSKSVILWVCEGSEPIVWLAKFQFPRWNGLDVVDKQTFCSLYISMAFNLGSWDLVNSCFKPNDKVDYCEFIIIKSLNFRAKNQYKRLVLSVSSFCHFLIFLTNIGLVVDWRTPLVLRGGSVTEDKKSSSSSSFLQMDSV